MTNAYVITPTILEFRPLRTTFDRGKPGLSHLLPNRHLTYYQPEICRFE